MDKIKTRLASLTTPKHLTPKNGIHFWQEKVLLNLLLVAVGIILIFTLGPFGAGQYVTIEQIGLAVQKELSRVI